jgi:hypothetical protein
MSLIGSSLSKGTDGTGLINPSVLGQIAGVGKDFSRAAFDTAVAQERSNIVNNGTGVWSNGEKLSIFGELGTRIWFIGANAIASHARNVLYVGKTYALAVDGNVFGATMGVPLNGTGVNGDYLVDAVTGFLYGPKAGNAWPAGVLVSGAASATGLVITGTGQTVASAASPYQWRAATKNLDLQNSSGAPLYLKLPEDLPQWGECTFFDAGTADQYAVNVSTTGMITGGGGTAATTSITAVDRFVSLTFVHVALVPSVWRVK